MLLDDPLFTPPRGQFEGHAQTILPSLLRPRPQVNYERIRIDTPDDDFLDLDCIRNGNSRVVIITHGLEGSSDSQYVLGTARLFSENNWDVIAWNCRSCSGEMNRQFRLYHHGDTEDIGTVVRYATETFGYRQVGMTGFSMGANITMKYLGTLGERAPSEILGAAVFSAPCDIEEGANVLDKPSNYFYKARFLTKLKRKILHKNQAFPGRLDVELLQNVDRWRDFDEWFSAPMFNYPNAAKFYENASAKNFVAGIRVPVLLSSSWNDPILTPACFPVEIARNHPHFHLQLTTNGGHCGYMVRGQRDAWSEQRALEFLQL